MNEPRTYPAGVTCWVDIEDADVEEAARFWCSLREIPDSRFAGRRFHTEPVLTTIGVLNAAAQRIRARRLPADAARRNSPSVSPAKERYGATHAILLSRIGCEIDPVSRRVRPKRT
jgi:hypothetical protein